MSDGLTERERAADLEAKAARLASGWRPIESAPKDGCPLLLGWVNSFLPPIVGHEEGGRWGVLGADMQFTVLQVSPTHWMPLPAAPEEIA